MQACLRTITGKTPILIVAAVFLITGSPLYTQTTDAKFTEVGEVRMLERNKWKFHGAGAELVCEYPRGSQREHIGVAEAMFGGITADGDTLVSTGSSDTEDEFWASDASWDTVWVIDNHREPVDIGGKRGDSSDIYLPDYKAVSDQDLVTHYSDYFVRYPNEGTPHEGVHTPLYLLVIESIYSWGGGSPLENVLVWTWKIVPTRDSVRAGYFGFRTRAAIGQNERDPGSDDRSLFFEEYNMLAFEDGPGGGDGDAVGALGYQVLPSEEYAGDNLRWTFLHGERAPITDKKYYETLSQGRVMADEPPIYGGFESGSHTYVCVGPFSVAPNDTLTLRMVQILGDSLDGLKSEGEMIQDLAELDFKVPTAPPAPKTSISKSGASINISWEEESRIEGYQDPYRQDKTEKPFEGYRIYRSTESQEGPWTAIAEFDLAGNATGANTGLQYEYTDTPSAIDADSLYYTVTAFSKPDTVFDWPSVESSLYTDVLQIERPTGLAEESTLPGETHLSRNHPNPFNPSTTIQVTLPEERHATLVIYDLLGRRVHTLAARTLTAGRHEFRWYGRNTAGEQVESGIYFYRLKTGEKEITRKMVLLR